MFKQKKGITLVALIVTIVILLILAGVVINLSLGENGIIGKAKNAVDKYKQVSENEKIQIAKCENIIDGNRNDIINSLANRIDELERINEYHVGDNITFTPNIPFIAFTNQGGSGLSLSVPLSKTIDSEVSGASINCAITQIDCNGIRYQASNFPTSGISIEIAEGYLRISIGATNALSSLQAAHVFFSNLVVTFN